MTRTPLFFINTRSGDGSKEVSAINLTIGRYQVEACAGQSQVLLNAVGQGRVLISMLGPQLHRQIAHAALVLCG